MASVIANPNMCIVCSTRVHSSNKKIVCVLCVRPVHLACVGSNDDRFFCSDCLSDVLPFHMLDSDDDFYSQLGINQYNIKRTLNDYPRLNINPYADLDTKFINNEFVDADTNHFNYICGQTCEYHDTLQMNATLPEHKSSNLQSMVHFNARSLSANLDILYSNLLLLKHKFSIIAVTETWADANTENAINISGYNKIMKPRDKHVASRGGGVALFYSSDLAINVKQRHDISGPENIIECLFVQISQTQLSVKDIIVGVVYRRPGTSMTDFNETFAVLLSKINAENRPCYILGDFNIDLLNTNNCNQLFLNSLLSSGFYPVIDRPTRIREETATLIDNIFVNIHNNQTQSGIWLADITDHLPIYCTLPYDHKPVPRGKTAYISKRTYSVENMIRFKNDLEIMDWSPVFQAEGINNKFDKFNNIITELHDKYFPLVLTMLKTKNLYKPWLSSSILNSIKKKNNLYKSFIRSHSPTIKAKYLKYKNKLVSIIRQAEKDYYANRLSEVRDNTSKTWKVMNEMCGRNSAHKEIDQIKTNDSIIEDPQEIANKFNEFFANVGPNLAKTIPTTTKQPVDFMKGNFLDSMYLSPTNEYEVSDIISKLKNTNSRGFDDIPVKLIKNSSSVICNILAYLNNQSFLDGTFPDLLKIAKVVPIHKSDDVKNIPNYRPISVLSAFSKISEKLMCARLNKYILDKSILHPNQYGFREKLSTAMALLKLTDDISRSIDDGNITVGVFIDLAKAFDTVDHKILLGKLNHYGIRGIANNWFASYLTNRMQYVACNKHHSTRLPIECGVPQGSILGPILFLLYINDLNQISSILRTIMFADDTNLFLSGKNINVLEQLFNKELEVLTTWFNTNLLSLNIKKTSYIIFSNRKKPSINIMLSGTSIKIVDDTKFLGVIISSNLNWNKHIDVVLNKISKTTGIISKVRHLLPRFGTRTLYVTLVEPYLSYCNIVWAQSKPTTYLDKIFRTQKKYCRLITFSHFQAHSEPLFRQLSLLNIYQLYQYQLGLFMFQQLRGLTPSPGLFSFVTNASIHDHFTRQHAKLHIKPCRTKKRRMTVVFQGPNLWNTLPPTLTECTSLTLFRKKMKTYLLTN